MRADAELSGAGRYPVFATWDCQFLLINGACLLPLDLAAAAIASSMHPMACTAKLQLMHSSILLLAESLLKHLAIAFVSC